jgi:hypothetical protein
LTAELEALVASSWKEATAFGTMSEGPRLNADLMFEDVFKEMPEHLQKQRDLMRSEIDVRTETALRADSAMRTDSSRSGATLSEGT